MKSPKVIYVIEQRRRDRRCKNWNFDSVHHWLTQQGANSLAWVRHNDDRRYDFRVAAYERTTPRS
jgi:hypothetical protein